MDGTQEVFFFSRIHDYTFRKTNPPSILTVKQRNLPKATKVQDSLRSKAPLPIERISMSNLSSRKTADLTKAPTPQKSSSLSLLMKLIQSPISDDDP